MPAKKDRKCKTCPTMISREAAHGQCRPCHLKSRRTSADQARLDHVTRVAEGKATTEDDLREENTELRVKLRTLDAAVATYRSKTRVEDRMVTEILKFIEKSPYKPQLRKPIIRKPGGKGSEHEMVALVSDAHYPEVVDPEATFGVGYNGDMCLRRLEYLRDKVIRYKDLRATSYPTRKLTVAVNGDMLSGNIHEELEVTNEMPIGEALVKMTYALYDMGKAFAEEFENVEFVVMPGNHPRLEKKPRMKNAWNNWEHVMGRFLGGLSQGAFTVTVPKDLVYVHPVFGFKIGVTHGDGVKSNSFAGIPFYGMKQRRDALQALLKTLGNPQLDMLCYGHFHQLLFEEGAGCSMVINGSIKGFDEYIVKTRYSGQQPVQALLTFHHTHGLTDISRINLGHIK